MKKPRRSRQALPGFFYACMPSEAAERPHSRFYTAGKETHSHGTETPTEGSRTAQRGRGTATAHHSSHHATQRNPGLTVASLAGVLCLVHVVWLIFDQSAGLSATF